MNKDGSQAAHLACTHNNVALAQFFVQPEDLEITDEAGNTPLVYAATHGCVDTFAYLVGKCASKHSPLACVGKSFSFFLFRGADVNVSSVDNHITPLMSCSRRGDTNMV